MFCWSLNTFDFARENCISASVQFFSAKSNELTDQQDIFALITHLLSIRATTSWKMLMNDEFQAQTSTGNPTGNSRCHILASCALNMSCSFGQSTCSIESRCVVILVTWSHCEDSAIKIPRQPAHPYPSHILMKLSSCADRLRWW